MIVSRFLTLAPRIISTSRCAHASRVNSYARVTLTFSVALFRVLSPTGSSRAAVQLGPSRLRKLSYLCCALKRSAPAW